MRPRNIANRIKNGRDIMMLWAGIAYNIKTLIVWTDLARSCSNGSEQIRAEHLNAEKQAEKIPRGPLCTTEQLFPVHHVLEYGAPCHSA